MIVKDSSDTPFFYIVKSVRTVINLMIKVSQISQSARTKFVALLLGLTPTLRLSFPVKGKELKRNRVFFSSFIPFKDITAISLSSLHPFPYPNLSRPPTQFLIFPSSLGRLSFPLPPPLPPSPLPPLPPPPRTNNVQSFLSNNLTCCVFLTGEV